MSRHLTKASVAECPMLRNTEADFLGVPDFIKRRVW